MQFPVPVPPVRRFISAADEVSVRSGVSVHVRYQHGRYIWAAVRTQGEYVLGVRSGTMEPTACGTNRGTLLNKVHAAVRQLSGSGELDVFCTSEETAASLRQLGLAVSAFYPPGPAITALDNAVRSCVDTLFTAVEIATDASLGRGSRWVGHGWILTFAGSVTPVLGHKALDVGNVLEGELRAIRFALLAARNAYTGTLDGRSAVTVSTDSQLALRMLLQPGFEPPSSNGRCASEVLRIRELTKHADVHFRWVKGHSGDPLNTFADRMAVLARRCREAGLSPEETDNLAAAVREEAEGQLLGSQLALAA